MSGILKRKLDEGPTPYLSPQRCDDNEVSCSDSGNSSDSLNHPVSSGGHDSSALQHQPKRQRGRNVHFESVTVYYFSRRQGFTSVPTQGGSTLGMSPRHCWAKRFTLREFALEQERSHRTMLREHLREEKLNAVKLKLTRSGAAVSAADAVTLDDVSEDDLELEHAEVDEYFFLQPLTTRRRRALLRASGVRRINGEEKHQLRALRGSREECGCRCRGACDPETCACSLAGIKCQVDRMSFPCGCTKEGCGNATGRLEFNPVRVRTHFLHTIMKLELEKSREQQQQHVQQQPVTNGNGYHGDPPSAQRQRDMPFPPVSGDAPQIPAARLRDAGEADSHPEEEEEEEDDSEEEDDEAYVEDEETDDSSLCSGLSDCSTHSLETIDPEEEEDENEDDYDDEGDDDYEDAGEKAEGCECSLDSASPPPFSHMEVVPLSSVLGFSSCADPGNRGDLSGSSPLCPPGDHRLTDSPVNETPSAPGLAKNAYVARSPDVTKPQEQTVDREHRCQTEHQSGADVPPATPDARSPPPRSHSATLESNGAPAGETDAQRPSTDRDVIESKADASLQGVERSWSG